MIIQFSAKLTCEGVSVAGGCLKGYAKTRLVAFGKVTISWLLGRRQMIFTHIRITEGRGLLYLWSHTCNYSVLRYLAGRPLEIGSIVSTLRDDSHLLISVFRALKKQGTGFLGEGDIYSINQKQAAWSITESTACTRCIISNTSTHTLILVIEEMPPW